MALRDFRHSTTFPPSSPNQAVSIRCWHRVATNLLEVWPTFSGTSAPSRERDEQLLVIRDLLEFNESPPNESRIPETVCLCAEPYIDRANVLRRFPERLVDAWILRMSIDDDDLDNDDLLRRWPP